MNYTRATGSQSLLTVHDFKLLQVVKCFAQIALQAWNQHKYSLIISCGNRDLSLFHAYDVDIEMHIDVLITD